VKRIISLGLLAVLMTAGPARAQEGNGPELRIDEIDQSDFPNIALTVTVPVEMNGLDLSPSNFFVAQGEQPVPLEVEQLPAAELHVALAIDVSGSMAGDIGLAKSAVIGFVDTMPPDVELALVSFGDAADLIVPSTADREPILSGIDGLEANDNTTALYDGLLEAVASFGPPDGSRRTIVLLGDGADSEQGADLDDALLELISSEADLLIVALETGETDLEALTELEARTGGTLVFASDSEALEAIYDEVASDLINQYKLNFEATAGGLTNLVVAVRTPDITAQGVTVARFPALPDATEAPTTTAPASTTTAAPEIVVAPPTPVEIDIPWIATTPGLMLGAAALFLAATALILLLMPSKKSVLAGFESLTGLTDRVQSSGRFSELTNKATLFAEDAIRRGKSESGLRLKLDQAGLQLREGEFLLLVFAAVLVAVVGAFLFAGIIAAVIAAVIVVLLAWSILGSLGTHRANKFRAQLPDSLQLITGSLRAGFGLNQAVTAVANELPAPGGEEYARAQLEVHLGREVEDALRSMAVRVQSEDLPWVAEAIEIHREIGGDVADLLDQVASTVRERERVRGQINVLSAEGRISGVVLVALPFAIAGLTLVSSPDYLTELTQSTVGQVMLAFGAVTMIIGIFWIRRIVRLEF
jgi:tight adherence protein B